MKIKFIVGIENSIIEGYYRKSKILNLTKIEDIEILSQKAKQSTMFLITSIDGIRKVKDDLYEVQGITLAEVEKV